MKYVLRVGRKCLVNASTTRINSPKIVKLYKNRIVENINNNGSKKRIKNSKYSMSLKAKEKKWKKITVIRELIIVNSGGSVEKQTKNKQ